MVTDNPYAQRLESECTNAFEYLLSKKLLEPHEKDAFVSAFKKFCFKTYSYEVVKQFIFIEFHEDNDNHLQIDDIFDRVKQYLNNKDAYKNRYIEETTKIVKKITQLLLYEMYSMFQCSSKWEL
jgi:hypothetical protein